MQASTSKPATPQLPTPFPSCQGEPFVGNISVDDNLRECVQVALWTATQGKPPEIVAEVDNGDVVLSGTVASEAARAGCEQKVREIAGVNSVTSQLDVREPWDREMLFATRYCQTIRRRWPPAFRTHSQPWRLEEPISKAARRLEWLWSTATGARERSQSKWVCLWRP